MARILIISHEFPPYIGGAGSVAESWVNALSQTNDVTLLTRFHPKRLRTGLSYTLYEVKSMPVIFPLYYHFFLKRLFKGGAEFDIIVLNDLGAAHVAALFFNKAQQRKCWLYFQGNEIEALFRNKSIKARLFLPYFKQLLAEVSQLLFASEFLQKKVWLEVAADQILKVKSVVIYPRIDHTMFFPNTALSRDSLGIAPHQKVMLTVARLVEQKGLSKLLWLLSGLKAKGVTYHWVLIGNGPYEQAIKDQIKDLGLSDMVTILNQTSRSALRDYYALADVFVLLSDFEESFGLVYLEANACGTPVIGRNKGGVAEVIKSGRTGFLVEDEQEALEVLLYGNIDELNRDEQIAWSKEFSMDALKAQVSDLITKNK